MTRQLMLPSGWRSRVRSAGYARIAENLPPLIAGATFVFFLALAIRLIDVGAADLGIAGLFSTDEKLAGQLVRAMLRDNNFGLSHFFSYGPLELYVARALLWIYGLARPITDEAVLVVLRAVSLASGAGCLYLTYSLGRRLWNGWTGAVGAVIVASSATFLAWSTTAHPDMLQLFLLLLGIWVATALATSRSGDGMVTSRRRTLSSSWLVVLGSICAALAFASKYSGELLLPALWLGDALGRLYVIDAPPGRLRAAELRALARDIILSGAVFVAAFAVLDPSALREWRSFLYQMTLEAGLAHRGHVVQAGLAPMSWLRLIGSGDVLGPSGLLLGLTALLAWLAVDLRSLLRRADPGEHAPRLPLELFTAGYVLFLLSWVGDQQPRYALPVLPGLAILAAAGLVWLFGRSHWGAAAALAALLLTLLPLGNRVLVYEHALMTRMRAPSVQDRIQAGRWLAARVPAGTPILADAYTYIPPELTHVEESFGLTRGLIQSNRPRFIMTDVSIRNRFLDPARASQYVDGVAAYREIAATYEELESGRMTCYPPLERFGPVAIYGRLGVDLCTTGT